MTNSAIVLVGGPDSGKTNYIARLWLAFKARKGRLRADRLPDDIQYVEDAVRHLMKGRFAPRSERNMEEGRRDFVIGVRDGTGPMRQLTVPDITGELWKRAIATYELPLEWIEALRTSSAAIVFVRAHSKYNVQPADWVTARDMLLHAGDLSEEDDDFVDDDNDDDVGDEHDTRSEMTVTNLITPVSSEGAPVVASLPAQVGFCELLRYLDHLLCDRPDGGKPRVAIVVTAYDMLAPDEKAAGPAEFIRAQFPLLSGRLSDPGRLEIETFGMSIVGGDLRSDLVFRERLKGMELSEFGYTARMDGVTLVEDPDVTLPLAWALGD